MKSFNEFVSIKESAFTDAQAAAAKSSALKSALNIAEKIEGILQKLPNTNLHDFRLYSIKIVFAIMSLIKDSSDTTARETYSHYGDPLKSAERMSAQIDATPNSSREIQDLKGLTAQLLVLMRSVR